MRNLKASVSLLLAVALLALLLGSCARSAPPPTPAVPPVTAPAPVAQPTPAPAPVAQPTPVPAKPTPTIEVVRRGGTLELVAARVDPHLDSQSVSSIGFTRPSYNTLVGAKPDGTIVPDLAKSWEISPDGRAVTLKLQQGVKWHDGKPFTAADVVANVKHWLNPPKGLLIPRGVFFTPITEMQAPDDYTVRLTLKSPYLFLMKGFALDNLVIAPKHILEVKGSIKDDMIGTGPFKLVKYEPGAEMVQERFPEYWEQGLPRVDRVHWVVIQDRSTQLASFRAGRIHYLSGLSTTEARTVTLGVKGATVTRHPTLGGMEALFDVRKKPFDDVRVRRAMFLATDFHEILAIPREGFLGPVFPAWSPNGIPAAELLKMPGLRTTKDEDIAEAKRLLAAAGYGSGFSFIAEVYQAAASETAELWKAQMAKLGLSLRPRDMDRATWHAKLYDSNYEVFINGFGAIAWDDPEDISTNGWKIHAVTWWDVEPQARPKLEAIQLAADPVQRQRLLREWQLWFVEQVPLIIFNWNPGYTAQWDYVKDWEVNFRDPYDGLRTVWLDK